MNNVSTANATVKAPQSWCYPAKVSGTAVKNNTTADFGIQPYKFLQQYKYMQPDKFTARETVKAPEKELQVTRMMAFGRSLTAESWS